MAPPLSTTWLKTEDLAPGSRQGGDSSDAPPPLPASPKCRCGPPDSADLVHPVRAPHVRSRPNWVTSPSGLRLAPTAARPGPIRVRATSTETPNTTNVTSSCTMRSRTVLTPADERAAHRPHAADHEQQQERNAGEHHEVGAGDGPTEHPEETAAEASHRGRQREHEQLRPHQVHTDGRARRGTVAQGDQASAEPPATQPHHEEAQQRERHRREHQEVVRVVEVDSEEPRCRQTCRRCRGSRAARRTAGWPSPRTPSTPARGRGPGAAARAAPSAHRTGPPPLPRRPARAGCPHRATTARRPRPRPSRTRPRRRT